MEDVELTCVCIIMSDNTERKTNNHGRSGRGETVCEKSVSVKPGLANQRQASSFWKHLY